MHSEVINQLVRAAYKNILYNKKLIMKILHIELHIRNLPSYEKLVFYSYQLTIGTEIAFFQMTLFKEALLLIFSL